ncbi:major facilitator superfamily [Heterobasidion irregulare TC 32-1]|uniref:Major facilitator superfamily n=1 Tax=Heterobasidion irregulare (strain TC 32-1) TaxID=747525 RepID=W4JYN0_HETIT|nr:major facilitator superfamily [Heterobasidion irregulare TC 32-1]ETW78559.1 major facilitator superfamily [Heterobasidion irregulare TC 32-1]
MHQIVGQDGRWSKQFHNPLTVYEPGSAAEKKLVRKIDMHIVPAIWILYTLSYLDRANIGNARSGGMERDLHLSSNQYSVILLVFFVSYVVFEVPFNMILTRVRPSPFLSGTCVIWGAVAASMAAVNTWHQMAGVRFMLGVIEAGFAPGVAFYLSSWYKRHELAKRYAIYYTATAISGAFSGLLAGVITEHLSFARGLEGWRWLLLIEGVSSSFVGLFAWIFLPDWPSTTSWLTPEERFIAIQRLAYDGIGGTQDATIQQPSHSQAAKMVLSDWRTWVLVVMYMLATGSQTIQYFIPTLVGQLGYTGYKLQFMTIPIYMVALVSIIGFCFISDWRQERANYITIASLTAGISFIVIVAAENHEVKYAFLCFAVGGVYAACPLTLLWVSGLIAHPAEKRAIAIALVNCLGNSASIYGSFLWPSATGPRYVQGFATTCAFVLLLAILAQVNRYLNIKYPPDELERRADLDASSTQKDASEEEV